MNTLVALALGCFLVFVAVSLLVGAARVKFVDLSHRTRTIVIGMVCLITGFTAFWYADNRPGGLDPAIPALLVGSVLCGVIGGAWYGHESGKHA